MSTIVLIRNIELNEKKVDFRRGSCMLVGMFAVIKTGGKQYIVSPGQKLRIEKLAQKEGEEVVFGEVLLVKEGEGVRIGTPFVQGVTVKGTIRKHGKGEKIIAFKFKAKKKEKRKKGHRQLFTEVEITAIA